MARILEYIPTEALSRPLVVLKDARENLFLRREIACNRRNRIAFNVISLLFVVLFVASTQEVVAFLIPYPTPTAERRPILIGEETRRFIFNLHEGNINSLVIRKVKRPELFSVDGVAVILQGDNVQIFEYPDAITATQEIQSVIDQYQKPRWERSWATPIRIYRKDVLVLYYMGTQEKIIAQLQENIDSPEVIIMHR